MKVLLIACLLFASALAQTDVTAEPVQGSRREDCVCTQEYAPVCADMTKEYANSCEAECHNYSAHDYVTGPCGAPAGAPDMGSGFSGGMPGPGFGPVGFPGAGMPMPMMGQEGMCEMFSMNADACRAHFPMCSWVYDEDMWACMESKEVESGKGFWASQNMPGAPQMGPMVSALIGAGEGEIPEMLPAIIAGGMPGPVIPEPVIMNPVDMGVPADLPPPNFGPIGGGAGFPMPMMPMNCELLGQADCGATPGCTWILDDGMQVCQETKEVENHKAFYISQQGQMLPSMPGQMGGGMPGQMMGGGMPAPMGPGPMGPASFMGGAGMGPMPGMMFECNNIMIESQCRARYPQCQWVLDEDLWACMEPKEVESGKGFWALDNMAQGGIFPRPSMPGMFSPPDVPATETTGEPVDGSPGLLKKAVMPTHTEDVDSSNHNNLILAGVTVFGFALGIILAFTGLHFRKKTQNFDTILLDEGGVIRQV